MTTPDAEVIAFAGAAAFEQWLEDHSDHQPGVWLKLAKAGSGIPSLTSDEAVDVGLCFGWISGQRRYALRPPSRCSTGPSATG